MKFKAQYNHEFLTLCQFLAWCILIASVLFSIMGA